MIEKTEKYVGRITKQLDSKMDKFIEWGLDNSGSIHVQKDFQHKFKPGEEGTFVFHRFYWGQKEPKKEVWILDEFIPLQRVEKPAIQPPTIGQTI